MQDKPSLWKIEMLVNEELKKKLMKFSFKREGMKEFKLFWHDYEEHDKIRSSS